MPAAYPEYLKAAAIGLYETGEFNTDEVAEVLEVSASSVRLWLKTHSVKATTVPDIRARAWWRDALESGLAFNIISCLRTEISDSGRPIWDLAPSVKDRVDYICQNCEGVFNTAWHNLVRTVEHSPYGGGALCRECARIPIHLERRKVYPIGHRVGDLVVVDDTLVARGDGKFQQLCRCGCGAEEYVITHRLNSTVSSRAVACTACARLRHRRGNSHPNWTGGYIISGTYWEQIQRGARDRGLEFTLTIEYIEQLFQEQDGRCALTGVDISLPSGTGEYTASLDRIDSSKGYVEGNVQWTHKDINRLKMDYPEEQFLEYCRLVTIHRGLV